MRMEGKRGNSSHVLTVGNWELMMALKDIETWERRPNLATGGNMERW